MCTGVEIFHPFWVWRYTLTCFSTVPLQLPQLSHSASILQRIQCLFLLPSSQCTSASLPHFTFPILPLSLSLSSAQSPFVILLTPNSSTYCSLPPPSSLLAPAYPTITSDCDCEAPRHAGACLDARELGRTGYPTPIAIAGCSYEDECIAVVVAGGVDTSGRDAFRPAPPQKNKWDFVGWCWGVQGETVVVGEEVEAKDKEEEKKVAKEGRGGRQEHRDELDVDRSWVAEDDGDRWRRWDDDVPSRPSSFGNVKGGGREDSWARPRSFAALRGMRSSSFTTPTLNGAGDDGVARSMGGGGRNWGGVGMGWRSGGGCRTRRLESFLELREGVGGGAGCTRRAGEVRFEEGEGGRRVRQDLDT